MRFLSMIRADETTGQRPSEQLMREMGQLIDEMTRQGVLISTAGPRPSAEGMRIRLRGGKLPAVDGPFTETKEVIGGFAITKRFLRIHGEEWDIECELRQLDGPA